MAGWLRAMCAIMCAFFLTRSLLFHSLFVTLSPAVSGMLKIANNPFLVLSAVVSRREGWWTGKETGAMFLRELSTRHVVCTL